MSLSDHYTIRRGKDLNDYSDRQDFEMVKQDRAWKREREKLLKTLPRWIPLQRRPEALRLWLEADLALSGHTLEGALATIKRGRLLDVGRPRRDALACGIALLRDRGVKLKSIGETIGRGPQTVANLEARGRELLLPPVESEPEPCQHHSTFEYDCPTCLRNAPERTPNYSGPEVLRGQLVGGYQDDD
jgi:hypothetical protein